MHLACDTVAAVSETAVAKAEAAWTAAYTRWKAADDARTNRPAGISDREHERLVTADCEAWSALLAVPAPHWNAVAWKVRQLLEVDGDGFTSAWAERLVNPLLADLDRLAGQGV